MRIYFKGQNITDINSVTQLLKQLESRNYAFKMDFENRMLNILDTTMKLMGGMDFMD